MRGLRTVLPVVLSSVVQKVPFCSRCRQLPKNDQKMKRTRRIATSTTVVQVTVEIEYYVVVSNNENCLTNQQLTGTFAIHISSRGGSTVMSTLEVGMRLPSSACETVDLVTTLAPPLSTVVERLRADGHRRRLRSSFAPA